MLGKSEFVAFDRCGTRRRDDAWLEETWADPTTRVLVFAGTRFAVGDRRISWVPSVDAPRGTRVLLGVGPEGPRFALFGDAALAEHGRWAGLRDAFGFLQPGEFELVVHAVGLVEWHHSHRHCPNCGGTLTSREAGSVLHCEDCGRDQFPRTDPAVIMLITDDDDRALLGRQPVWPSTMWSTLAGFVEPGERLEDAVRREVLEESGILVGEVTYAGSQPWPLPASLMLGFNGRAHSSTIVVDKAELDDARWFSREEATQGAEDGTFTIPPGISISRALITAWYGGELPSPRR